MAYELKNFIFLRVHIVILLKKCAFRVQPSHPQIGSKYQNKTDYGLIQSCSCRQGNITKLQQPSVYLGIDSICYGE